MLELGWIERMRSGRALRITERGERGLRERFGVMLERPAR
jgi:hypothetical protein